MTTYKLFRIKQGRLYPLYVEADREMKVGEWLKSGVGEAYDATHVKAKGCGGHLRRRSGFHSTIVPFTDWIGKKQPDGTLIQRKDTVWCECEIKGNQIEAKVKNGYDIVPDESYYFFRTNSKQKEPWIISDKIKIKRVLTDAEVSEICAAKGIVAQRKEI